MDINICLYCERPLSPTTDDSNDETTKCFCSENCHRCEAMKAVWSNPGPDNGLRFFRIAAAGSQHVILPGDATPLHRCGSIMHSNSNRTRGIINNTNATKNTSHDPQRRKRSASTPLCSTALPIVRYL
ncbi:hypothetical protein VTP01DRAFT_1294 [Rhizomucor pusillus]|uniref:uncharacterized protein n=1 Tax=Rhizomucor pusillus TaxID=4840 RepID=UPI0037448F90